MIKILDNFFDKNTFMKVKNFTRSTSIKYKPRYFDPLKEKTEENTYGLRFQIANNKDLQELFLSQIENKFNLKIKSFFPDSGIDKRRLIMLKPHVDSLFGKLNCFIMLDGPPAVTNGICFYNNENHLDMHIGFLENRAILFPSNIFHSSSVSTDKELWRTTATIFITDYDEHKAA